MRASSGFNVGDKNDPASDRKIFWPTYSWSCAEFDLAVGASNDKVYNHTEWYELWREARQDSEETADNWQILELRDESCCNKFSFVNR
jgi:hypothetical protein